MKHLIYYSSLDFATNIKAYCTVKTTASNVISLSVTSYQLHGSFLMVHSFVEFLNLVQHIDLLYVLQTTLINVGSSWSSDKASNQ